MDNNCVNVTPYEYNERTKCLEAALHGFVKKHNLEKDLDDIYVMGQDLIHFTINTPLTEDEIAEVKEVANTATKGLLEAELKIEVDPLNSEGDSCTLPDDIPVAYSILFDMQVK